MRFRACPLCFTKIPRTHVLSRSNDLVCPACHAQLELSRPSRVLGSFVGILAALLVFHLAHTSNSQVNWTLPIVAAILAFGFASALALLLASDLIVRSPIGLISTPFPHGTA